MVDVWHALYCEPQRELFARDRLLEQGVEVFCPYEKTVKRRAVAGRPGQFKSYKIDVPVYAPYIFVKTDRYLLVDQMPGVINIVGICGKPLRVPDAIIDKLKAVANSKGLVEKDVSKPSFWFQGKVGDSFVVGSESPLAGFLARISSVANLDSGEVNALIKMLGKEQHVVLPLNAVSAIRHRDSEGDDKGPLRST